MVPLPGINRVPLRLDAADRRYDEILIGDEFCQLLQKLVSFHLPSSTNGVRKITAVW